MDLNSVEAIMRLHQQVASRLPPSITAIVTNPEEPRMGPKDAELMRAVFEERLRTASEARDRSMAQFEIEIGALKQAIDNVANVSGDDSVKTRPQAVNEPVFVKNTGRGAAVELSKKPKPAGQQKRKGRGGS